MYQKITLLWELEPYICTTQNVNEVCRRISDGSKGNFVITRGVKNSIGMKITKISPKLVSEEIHIFHMLADCFL
jgi:hypothetical protein